MDDKNKASLGLAVKHRLAAKSDSLELAGKSKPATPDEIARESMNSNLKIDEKSSRPARTRNELYNELIKDEKVLEEEDYYEFPNPVNRGAALFIDVVFAYVVIGVFAAAAPLVAQLWHVIFLDKYHLQFIFGEEAMIDLIRYLSIVLSIFFLIVLPVVFFNQSLGKKIAKIKVRGTGNYTLRIPQIFIREVVYKPIGILCLVGFILPFFDKKKMSLHDKLVGTFVVKE